MVPEVGRNYQQFTFVEIIRKQLLVLRGLFLYSLHYMLHYIARVRNISGKDSLIVIDEVLTTSCQGKPKLDIAICNIQYIHTFKHSYLQRLLFVVAVVVLCLLVGGPGKIILYHQIG